MFKTLTEALSTPSAAVLAQRELQHAERELLAALSAREYAAAMVDFHSRRVQRLREFTERGAK